MPRRDAAVAAAKNISNISDDDIEIEDDPSFLQKGQTLISDDMADEVKVTKLCSITGSTKEVATNLLSVCNGSLEMAIDMCTEDTTKKKANYTKGKNARKRKQSSDEEFSENETTEASDISSPENSTKAPKRGKKSSGGNRLKNGANKSSASSDNELKDKPKRKAAVQAAKKNKTESYSNEEGSECDLEYQEEKLEPSNSEPSESEEASGSEEIFDDPKKTKMKANYAKGKNVRKRKQSSDAEFSENDTTEASDISTPDNSTKAHKMGKKSSGGNRLKKGANKSSASSDNELKDKPKRKAAMQADKKNKTESYSNEEESESDLEYQEEKSGSSNSESSESEEVCGSEEIFDDPPAKLGPFGTKSRPHESPISKSFEGVIKSVENGIKTKKKKKPKSKPFSGKGHLLGNASSSSPKKSQSEAKEVTLDLFKKAQDELKVDENQGTTNIQIRLPDGQGIKVTVNHTHTVGDLKQFVSTARPELRTKAFTFRTSYPNKELSNDAVTIKDGGLAGAAIFLKLK